MRFVRLFVVLALSLASWSSPVRGSPVALYVAPDGSDVSGDGSFAAPWATLAAASLGASPGAIIYLRGGVYYWPVEQTFQASGVAEAPITITHYPGEVAILDGSLATLSSLEAILRLTTSYVTVDGLEFRNSAGRGISVTGSNDITIRNNYVHHIQQRAIGGGADNILIESNEVAFTALVNENGALGAGGWPGGISSYTKSDGSLSQNWTIRNNFVHDIWGECLIALRLNGFLVEGNVLRNCWSVMLYIDKAANGTARGNDIAVTTSLYDESGLPAIGIYMAAEKNSPAVLLENILITHNTISDTAFGLKFWFDQRNTQITNSYRNLTITQNVITGTVTYPFYFDSVPSNRIVPAGNVLSDNVFVPGLDGNTIFIGNPEGWTLGANGMPTPTSLPTLTPTDTAAPSDTPTPTDTATPSATPAITDTPTDTPTPSDTPTIMDTSTNTPIPSGTPTPTNTPANTLTATIPPTSTKTRTPTQAVTNTPTVIATSTRTLTRTPTQTVTATPTVIVTSTPTSTTTPTRTATNTSTIIATLTRTPTRTLTPSSTLDLIFADGFETNNFSAWSANAPDSGDLSVTSAAALVGVKGAQAVLDDNNAIYLTDDRPNAEARYRVRFYFDPNTIAMANNDQHAIWVGYAGASTEVVRVEFRRSGSQYQVRGSLRNDASTWTNTSWFDLSDAPHFVEIDWRAATGPGGNNGGLTFWLDGAQRANVTNVDNDTRRIDRIRLGATGGIDSGTRGAYYFDAFESHRNTYIGP